MSESLEWVNDTRYQIMEAVGEHSEGLRLTRISEHTDIAKSTVAKAIPYLLERGWLRKDGNKVYHLTVRGHEILSALWELKQKQSEGVSDTSGDTK